jgi:ATP-dependent DNA ligase
VIRTGGTARIWSRQRNDLTDRFRDIAIAAVSQLPDGVVLDGELVVSTNGRLDFDALQKRLVTTSPVGSCGQDGHPARGIGQGVWCASAAGRSPP